MNDLASLSPVGSKGLSIISFGNGILYDIGRLVYELEDLKIKLDMTHHN